MYLFVIFDVRYFILITKIKLYITFLPLPIPNFNVMIAILIIDKINVILPEVFRII